MSRRYFVVLNGRFRASTREFATIAEAKRSLAWWQKARLGYVARIGSRVIKDKR